MRWFLCALVWLAAMAAVVYVAANDWGASLIDLSGQDAIRSSDVAAVVLAMVVAGAVTIMVWATAPDRRAAAVAVRWVLCGVVWVGVMVSSLYVAAKTRLGPIVVTLSDRHGIHLSDILVILLGVAVASALTILAWRTAPGGRQASAPAGLDGRPLGGAGERG